MKKTNQINIIKEEFRMNPLLIAVFIIGIYFISTYEYNKELNKITDQMKEMQKIHEKRIEMLDSKNKATKSYYENFIEIKNNQIKKLIQSNKTLKNNILLPLGEFEATAYDLSIQSCGKSRASRGYGITANGTSLVYHTRKTAMTIATDPNIIPLGTKVYIEFPEQFSNFNGVYTANDTGSAIKGNIIDLFMGDFQSDKTSAQVWDFGRRKVKIYKILNK